MILENKDCIEFLQSLPDRSIDLMCIDPPYYKVVDDEWDKQWFTSDNYYEWCEKWINELGRVAKWNCSFWLFGFPKQLCTVLPMIEAAGFNFRQQIVIDKGMQAVAGRVGGKLKMFPTATESIFFFHYDARDYIRELLQSERKRLNMTSKDCNLLLGKATNGGGTFSCIASEVKHKEHRVYPTKEDWQKFQTVMNLPEYDDLVYTFNMPMGLTDVWWDINFYDRGEKKFHSTQKPIPLMERLVATSSNPGQTVLDIFSGSGSTAIACKLNDRKFVGCEVDQNYYTKSLERIENFIPSPKKLTNTRGKKFETHISSSLFDMTDG